MTERVKFLNQYGRPGLQKIGFALFWLLSGILVAIPVLTIEIRDDEGLYAMHTWRILQGQWPGIDFPHMYTGGMLFYNALLFLLLGSSLQTQRIGQLLVFAGLAFLVYRFARQQMPVRWSMLVTSFTLAMSVCLYPFLNATWNALALTFLILLLLPRIYAKERAIGLQIVTGALVALAVVIKQNVGLYTAFTVYTLLCLDLIFPLIPADETSPPPPWLERLGKGVIWLGLFIPAYLFLILKNHFQFHLVLAYGIPSLTVLGTLLWALRTTRPTSQLYARLAARVLWMLAGFIGVFGIFLVPFLMHGGIGQFIESAILKPWFYYQNVIQDFLNGMFEVASLVIALALLGFWLMQTKYSRLGLCLVLLATGLAWAEMQENGIGALVFIWVQLPFWVLLIGFLFFAKTIKAAVSRGAIEPSDRLAVMTYIAGVFIYISTYPLFAIPFVACNIAPLALLLGYLVYRYSRSVSGPWRIPFALFLAGGCVFGLLRLYQYDGRPLLTFLSNPLAHYSHYLDNPHGKIKLTKTEYEKRQSLLDFIQERSTRPNDFYILADDVPEIYLLSGHINPTRYDYYLYSLPPGGTQDLIDSLEAHQTRYIFLEPARPPLFKVDPALIAYLNQYYRPTANLPQWLVLERFHP